MKNVIRLRSWLSKHLEKDKVKDSPRLNDLYFHYQRMRLFEAELKKSQ